MTFLRRLCPTVKSTFTNGYKWMDREERSAMSSSLHNFIKKMLSACVLKIWKKLSSLGVWPILLLQQVSTAYWATDLERTRGRQEEVILYQLVRNGHFLVFSTSVLGSVSLKNFAMGGSTSLASSNWMPKFILWEDLSKSWSCVLDGNLWIFLRFFRAPTCGVYIGNDLHKWIILPDLH